MSSTTLVPDRPVSTRRPLALAGRAFAALPVLMLLASAAMKLSQRPPVLDMFVGHFGYPASALVGIGLIELACTVLYAIPRTSLFGALLLTAYLGGATATHVRIGESFLNPVVVGVLVWAALLVRDARVRELVLGRRDASDA